MVEVRGGMVLLVDDDDGMRDAIQRLLGTAGFECGAYVAAEALLARRSVADVACVVCDLKLPGASGFELLAELRARGAAPPFILITAHDAPGLREEAARRGAAAYLAKPFRGTALLDAIKSVARPALP